MLSFAIFIEYNTLTFPEQNTLRVRHEISVKSMTLKFHCINNAIDGFLFCLQRIKLNTASDGMFIYSTQNSDEFNLDTLNIITNA